MVDAHKEAQQRIAQTFIAAVLVQPLDPGITRDELERVVIASGISPPVFAEVADAAWARATKTSSEQAIANTFDFTMFLMVGDNYPPDLFPLETVRRLESAFDQLERELGEHTGKSAPLLLSRCPSETPEGIEGALGFLIALGDVEIRDDGFVRRSDFSNYLSQPSQREPHPWSGSIRDLKPLLEQVFAARANKPLHSAPPIDRFHQFLRKQGSSELAEWWVMTSREMNALGKHYPTAVTVLAGALLEAALVAIAEPARKAKEWRNKFLNNAPASWKLGELVDQAKSAGTLSDPAAALALNVAELRNRIHVGRFAAPNTGRLAPPCTNAHEADLAKLHLERVLDAILSWPTVAALS